MIELSINKAQQPEKEHVYRAHACVIRPEAHDKNMLTLSRVLSVCDANTLKNTQ